MIKYGNPQEVEEYFGDGSANQSYLKNLIKGVDFLGEKEEDLYYKEKGHFTIGSAVDVWITQGKMEYDRQYYVMSDKKPSDAMMSMVKMVFDQSCFDEEAYDGELASIHPDVLLDALNYHKYQARWKEETRLNKVVEEGSEYFEELKKAHGKKLLSSKEDSLTHNIVMSLQSGEYTADYFRDSPTVDVYFQVPVYFEYNGIPCKILLDMLRVDKEFKTIEPIDLKTMAGFTVEFPWAVRARRYDFQGAFYTEGLMALVQGHAKCDKLEIDVTNWQVKMFKFIVETTHTVTNKLTDEVMYFTGKPLVFRMSKNMMEMGKKGRPELVVVGGTNDVDRDIDMYDMIHNPIHGFEYGLGLHEWHTEHGFEKDRDVHLSQGVILLK